MNNMNNFNNLNNTENHNNYNNNRDKRENKTLNALVYIIVMITLVMVAPLAYKLVDDYANSRALVSGDTEIIGERNVKNKKYTVVENTIDISGLKNTEFGMLGLLKVKLTDNSDVILICSGVAEKPAPAPVTEPPTQPETDINGLEIATESVTDIVDTADNIDNINLQTTEIPEVTTEPETTEPEYEDVLRIAMIKNDGSIKNIPIDTDNITKIQSLGNIEVCSRAVKYDFLQSIQNSDYIYKDYSDGTFFMSNNKTAFLFDIDKMRISSNYAYPSGYNVYHSSLSNNKELLAVASEEGFFVGNLAASNMTLTRANMKELISTTITENGISLSARYPVWSNDDERIYYKYYAGDNVRNAGVTTSSPGGNEQLTALDCPNFIFLNNDSIFYYFMSNSETSQGNAFRCGYFNSTEKKMNELMKSQIYYFNIDISSNGTHLAALSFNGNMIKISVIDIRTKKLIYSCLYNDIYDFSFSPNEKNFIIYGKAENRNTLKVINIDWTED